MRIMEKNQGGRKIIAISFGVKSCAKDIKSMSAIN